MKNIPKLISNLNSQNIFRDLYQMGFTQDDIKQQIIEFLTPYFTNADNLKKYAINFLVPDFINLIKVKNKYPGIEDDIQLVLKTYKIALSENRSLLFENLKLLMPDLIETGNKYWTFLNLENDKSNLEIYEFVKESLDDISNLIEGLLKFSFIEQVIVNRIIRRKPFNIEAVKTTKLGVLINELIQVSPYPYLFTTTPDSIKYSDWRNISAHQSYTILEDKIICTYGTGSNIFSIIMTRNELFERVRQIARTLEVFNLAHKFFGFDNMESLQIAKEVESPKSLGRDEMWLLFFTTGLNSQGFEIVSFDFKRDGNALMIIRDNTGQDPKARGIHSSQFIMPIWIFTRSKNITIEYRLKNDKLFLRSSSNSLICEPIEKGDKNISYLAKNVDFEIINI